MRLPETGKSLKKKTNYNKYYNVSKNTVNVHLQTVPGTGMDCAAYQEEMTPLNLPPPAYLLFPSPTPSSTITKKNVAVAIPSGPNRQRSTIDANSKYTFK